MKIVIAPKMTKIIYNQVKKHMPLETKGALFAKRVSDDLYEVESVYIEKKAGTVVFVKLYNNSEYQRFQDMYHEVHHQDYKNHNYIGDWHSHPSFPCFPSSYDISEVELDLKNSNAEFLIQVIVKIENERLIGNAFMYNESLSAVRIDLEINH